MSAIDTLLGGAAVIMESTFRGILLLPEMAGREEDFAVTTVALPLPPSTNSLYPGRARRRKSEEYKAWGEEAQLWVSMSQQPHLYRYGTLGVAPERAQWKLHQFIFMKDWRSDMDNRYKASIDFLCGLYGLSDRYLVQHSAVRCFGPETGIVNVVSWGNV